MKLTTDALIIRENNNIGEADRFVTALTRDLGVVHASVKGARRVKNPKGPATQLLCYSRLSLFRGRDKYIVDDAEPLEVFFGVRGQLETLSLAQYFCELAGVLCAPEEPAEDALRVLLGALHYLSKGTRSPSLVKAVVEMRLLCTAGYAPDLTVCGGCRAETVCRFSPIRGTVLCDACVDGTALPLSPGVLAAMRHIVYAPLEKCFSFSLSEDSLRELSHVCERFLLAQVDRGFKTLDFYHSLEI